MDNETVAAALLSTGEYAAGVGSSQLVRTLWARDLSGFLASLSVAVPVAERHCQKLTVFCASANRSATFPGGKFLATRGRLRQ